MPLKLDPRLNLAGTSVWIKGKIKRVIGGRSFNGKLGACVPTFQTNELVNLIKQEGQGKISDANYQKGIRNIFKEALDGYNKLQKVVAEMEHKAEFDEVIAAIKKNMKSLEKQLKDDKKNFLGWEICLADS